MSGVKKMYLCYCKVYDADSQLIGSIMGSGKTKEAALLKLLNKVRHPIGIVQLTNYLNRSGVAVNITDGIGGASWPRDSLYQNGILVGYLDEIIIGYGTWVCSQSKEHGISEKSIGCVEIDSEYYEYWYE